MNIDINFVNLRALIEKLKTLRFFQRLFRWGSIKNLFIDAFSEFEKISIIVNTQASEITRLENEQRLLQSQHDNLKNTFQREHDELNSFKTSEPVVNSKIADLNTQIATKEATIASLTAERNVLSTRVLSLQGDLSNIQSRFEEVNNEKNALKHHEELRQSKHEQTITSLETIKNKIEADRELELTQKKVDEEIKRISLNNTWNKHQEVVKERMKGLAQKLIIEYIDNVPFKGTPDNTLKICDEYVVFDAKSPRGEDLTNFPTYLKKEAEAAKKYASKEDVKSDIFFVVPSNTLEKIETFVHKFGEYTVYIVSIDSIEPVIVGLKRIEDYEFAEQLSPEDREDICRIIGRFAHLSKRRIQVDNFFAKHFIELAYKCENELPDDILKMVLEYEKSEKLNPPIEKKVKSIPTVELDNSSNKLKQEAESRGILIESSSISDSLDDIPLYKGDK